MEEAETIVALSSGALPAGVAVVRISGPACSVIADQLIGGLPAPRRAALRLVENPGFDAPIDQAIVLWFPAPNSFTGEDVLELQLHGGRAVVTALIDALTRIAGVRVAQAGEFSRRALMNGKLDLTALEGLADLISAETEAQRVQALGQARGRLEERCDAWRSQLIRARALIEAEFDFSEEEDVPNEISREGVQLIEGLAKDIRNCLDNDDGGEIIREGFKVALIGRPNAGKSSLLNALAQRDVAIVTDEAGTTRDVLSVDLDLGGYKIIVSDTAGLREAASKVEQEGVRRAMEQAKAADLVIWLQDMDDKDGAPELNHGNLLVIRSKDDDGRMPAGASISAKTGHGMEALIQKIGEHAEACSGNANQTLITRARHREALEKVCQALTASLKVSESNPELSAEQVRNAGEYLGRITGRVNVEELLDVIFSEFCIGK